MFSDTVVVVETQTDREKEGSAFVWTAGERAGRFGLSG